MFHLPSEIIQIIYEYDDTYRIILKYVFSELRGYKQGKNQKDILKPSLIVGKYIKSYC